MLLCLQGYDYIIHYHPGKEMVLPNALSHFSPCPGHDIPLGIAIHHACLSPDQKEAFQQAFVSDSEMHALADIIITGWPDDIKEVPHPLHPYWQHCKTLTIEDGLVLCGEALNCFSFRKRENTTVTHMKFRGISGISIDFSYIGQCALINTCFELLHVWYTSGGAVCVAYVSRPQRNPFSL